MILRTRISEKSTVYSHKITTNGDQSQRLPMLSRDCIQYVYKTVELRTQKNNESNSESDNIRLYHTSLDQNCPECR